MNIWRPNEDQSWTLSIDRQKSKRRRRLPITTHDITLTSFRDCEALTCRGGSCDNPTESSSRPSGQFVRPRFVVEFDSGIGPSYRRVSSSVLQQPPDLYRHRPTTLSLSMDASPCLHRTANTNDTITINHLQPPLASPTAATAISPPTPLTLPTTLLTILTQSALLLPPLLLTRRILNSTANAIIDYFRGRYFRTTFTRLERAYLRYYEFPAAIRAIWRVASQIGILEAWSWMVRCWMGVVSRSEDNFNLYTFIHSNASQDIDWRSEQGCLPCLRAGKGIPWFCGIVWIGAVVGAGHACAMAVRVDSIVRSFFILQTMHSDKKLFNDSISSNQRHPSDIEMGRTA